MTCPNLKRGHYGEGVNRMTPGYRRSSALQLFVLCSRLSLTSVGTLEGLATLWPRPAHQGGGHCSECHGAVETRDVLQQEVSTSMNFCHDCHRNRGAPMECVAC